MHPNELINGIGRTIKSNAPEILTGIGVVGVASTSYLVGVASFKAANKIRDKEALDNRLIEPSKKERFIERTKLVWKLYIPAGVSGIVTAGCIVGASRVSGRRTVAAVAAYSLTERAFTEYREHVIEEIGKGKEQKIRDEIAQKRVLENPPNKEVLVIGGGQVLCCELRTKRYFRSDHETLRRAMNDLNEQINNELFVSMDDWYDLIGLAPTSVSSYQGWTSDKLMNLEFSTVLSPDGEPCLAFDYNYVKLDLWADDR